MEAIQANLMRANLLSEKIGYEKIWNIEVTEFGVHIQAYKCMGVCRILGDSKFEVSSTGINYVTMKRGKYYKVTITTNK